MGSFLGQFALPRSGRGLRLAIVLAVLAAVSVAALVSSAFGSTFPGVNGKLVFVVQDGKHANYLATAYVGGTGPIRLTKPSKKPGDLQPRFSVDGTKVVFIRNPATLGGYTKVQLWEASSTGTGAHQVKIKGLPKDTYPLAPTFTRDGKHIVFEDDTINAPAGIWEVPVAGGKATQLTNGNDYQPTVSPDGKKLAFFRASSLVIANINGSNPQTLYTEPAGTTSSDEPDFSPDGSTIAFMAYDSSIQSFDIWTVPANGSAAATNLTNGTNLSSMDPAYSPDGTQIAFTSVDNSSNATTIDVMPADGGKVTAVVTPSAGTQVFNPDWGVQPFPKHHKKHHKH
jgi:Tol biopolymer transport system component